MHLGHRSSPSGGRLAALLLVCLTMALGGCLATSGGPRVESPDATAAFRAALERATPAPAGPQVTYRQAPLHFEPNRGQAEAAAEYVARGQGYSLALGATEAALTLRGKSEPARTVRMRLAGADPAARGGGLEPQPGRVHYYVGNDPAAWRTDLPTYAKVRYQGVYPGVDVVYYGNQSRLEYDFVVAPGADPAVIGLEFAGVDNLEIAADGSLRLTTGGGAIAFQAPQLYQERDGRREPVAGGYVRRGPTQVGFQVAAYDAARPLVIDPVLLYASYVGTGNFDRATGVGLDAAGNIYISGTSDPYAFVVKMNSGGVVQFATFVGGGGEHDARLAVDGAGNLYLAGVTMSDSFPTTAGVVQATKPTPNNSTIDGFALKMNAAGNLVWATYLGGSEMDFVNAVAFDGAGNVYLTGGTQSLDFPTTVGAFQRTSGGGNCGSVEYPYPCDDAFVVKLNSTGTALVYATLVGGGGNDRGTGIAVDGTGHAYVTGATNSTDFPTTAGAYQQTANGGNCGSVEYPYPCEDAFILKLNGAGSALAFSTYLGGAGNDGGHAVALGGAGKLYVTGWTNDSDFATTGAYRMIPVGQDAFYARLDGTTGALEYATYLGGSNLEVGEAIAVDGAGNVYLAGWTGSPDFPLINPVQAALAGNEDGFYTKFSPAGFPVLSTYLGGGETPSVSPGMDSITAMAVNGQGIAFLVGSTDSRSFPVTPGAFQTAYNEGMGYQDGFLAVVSPGPNLGLLPHPPVLWGAGSHHMLMVDITPGPFGEAADVYLALQLPDHSLLFYTGGGNFVNTPAPIAANWTIAPYAGAVFDYTFNGTEPYGSYTWLGAFARPGTQFEFIGPVYQASFTNSPPTP